MSQKYKIGVWHKYGVVGEKIKINNLLPFYNIFWVYCKFLFQNNINVFLILLYFFEERATMRRKYIGFQGSIYWIPIEV